jgi:hypothetical protein
VFRDRCPEPTIRKILVETRRMKILVGINVLNAAISCHSLYIACTKRDWNAACKAAMETIVYISQIIAEFSA